MKYLLLSFALLHFFSCSSPTDKRLPKFDLTFISGCNSITKSKINVYRKGSKYFADHTSPSYFDGRKIDSLWTIELNEIQINACIKFLDKAKSLPGKCDRSSSVENHHIVVIDLDTIDINGDCNWQNLDFDFLDQQLFGKKHSEINENKKSYIATLDKDLAGKWYLQPLTGELQRDDLVIFSKSKVTPNFIVFGVNNSLTGNCKDLFKMKDLKRYKTEISDGWNETVLTIDWGKVTLVKDYDTWYEFGATFTLESISQDQLKLNFLWINN